MGDGWALRAMAMISLATAVPSTPHTGHLIGDGMRPFSGTPRKRISGRNCKRF
jgi:hypothetical protein